MSFGTLQRPAQVRTEPVVKKMEVVGVRVEMPTNQPIVLLKEVEGERYLPIWIGPVEATAIAFAQQGMVPARPLTHDLFRDVLEALGVQLNTVNITALRDGIFFADLIFSNGKEVSARPSDSIALALRTGASIFASDETSGTSHGSAALARYPSVRRSWTRPGWRSRTNRRMRSRNSASFSTPSPPKISVVPRDAELLSDAPREIVDPPVGSA